VFYEKTADWKIFGFGQQNFQKNDRPSLKDEKQVAVSCFYVRRNGRDVNWILKDEKQVTVPCFSRTTTPSRGKPPGSGTDRRTIGRQED